MVNCRECITGRHLLERTVAAVHESLREGMQNGEHGFNERCENLSALTVHLQRLLRQEEGFVLVFDGVDKRLDAPPTLLPALARLGEFVPNLTSVLIMQYASPHALHKPGVPHVYFTPYSRNQSIHILSQRPPQIFTEPPPDEMEYDDEQHEEDKKWLWPRFCAAVWDSLGKSVARDLVAFRDACYKLWRPFVAPIVKGEFGTRDFTRLVVSQRRLFQEETVLLDSIVSAPSNPTEPQQGSPPKPTPKAKPHHLPYYAKWLLIAAYLASYTPTKLDPILFMKTSDRKKRKKSAGRPAQTRKVPRHLLAPSAFPLDRLLSILHAILPHDLRTTIDVYSQIATLASLRLMVRSGGIGGMGGGDPLERGGKWRVGGQVGWEYVLGLARTVQFELGEYVIE